MMTFGVLRIFSISLVFFSVYAVLNKIFYSLNETKLLLLITIAGLSIKLLFNFLLIDLEQNGLALSTSISYLFFFSASYTILNVKLKIKDKLLFAKEFLLHLINCAVSLISIEIISDIYQINNLLKLVLVITSFILLYLFNLVLIKHDALVIASRVVKRLNLKKIFMVG
jgi:putative peptidoglycan lipid II flippase